MIQGVGLDIIEIARIREAIERHGRHFISHVFTERELAHAPEEIDAAARYYAGRWAAKEACVKALGTGIGTACRWHDIEVERTDSGQPRIVLSGAGRATAQELGMTVLHVSISHEKKTACAVVVGENCEL